MKKRAERIVPLSDTANAIILGTLLGDASLKKQKGYAHARLQIRHSRIQEDYLRWKAEMLSEIAGEKSVIVQKPDGYSVREKLRFVSKATSMLDAIYQLTHKHNTLRITRAWLNRMTPLSLAIWWCDDGSLISTGGRKGVFCTDGFDKASVQTLARYLEVVWGIRTTVAPVGRKRDGTHEEYWRVWIRSTEELKKFLRIILPHIPVASMLRKTILLYHDEQLQQRWISEVIARSQFSESVVLTEYEKRCAQLRDFR